MLVITVYHLEERVIHYFTMQIMMIIIVSSQEGKVYLGSSLKAWLVDSFLLAL